MQKKPFRFIAITAGLLSVTSLLFLSHQAKEKTQESMIHGHRGLVKWRQSAQFYGRM